MQQEFILRDGEIAFNMPDGTVTIMNVNTYLQLQKALKEQEEKEEGPSFFEVAVGLLLAAGAAADPEDPSDPEPENKKILTDEAFKKWARLPENEDKVNNKDEVKPAAEKVPPVPAFAIDGDNYTNGPFIYVASDGRLFRSAKEVEKFYNLAKNSVSSFFYNKQKYLYQGYNSKGRLDDRNWFVGKKIGLTRICSDSLWTNVPTVGAYGLNAAQVKQNYNTYRFAIECAEKNLE